MLKDMIGFISGKLSVIERVENAKDGTAMWLCVCECGEKRIHRGNTLRNNFVKSCGCSNAEFHTKHSKCFTPEYKSWQGMKERCLNPKSKNFENYGGRGITIHERWINSFESFYSDMGPKEKGQSIDRINNNGNYEPGNCRWANNKTQSNNRRSSKFFTNNGETLNGTDWAKKLGISPTAFYKRISSGKGDEYIFSKKMK